MKRVYLTIAMILLAGCMRDPTLTAGVHADENGVTVNPAMYGNIGGASVSVRR